MPDILVVGAGPTGLTMAAGLARFGVQARLIDRALEPPEDRSRAIVLQARTLELFEDLGIVRKVLDAGLVVDAANIFTRHGRRGSIRIRPEWIDSAYGRFVTLPQEETERILGELVVSSGVAIERGVELIGIEESEGAATAVLRHHGGRIERMPAAWIVGCDGAHSAVRQAAGLSFEGSTYRDECLLGDVDMRWGLPEREVSICPSAEGVLLAFPLPGEHRFRIIMILPATAAPDERRLSLEEFSERVRSTTPRSPTGEAPTVLHSRWLTRYRLHRRGVPTYRKGRCFVAGDAAHIHSPAGAQGMNTGIQDAYNLAWKLAWVARGEAAASLLDTYHQERHPVGQRLLRTTDRMFALLAGGGVALRLVRRLMPTLGVRLLGAPRLGQRIARFVSQTAIRYRHSALSVDGATALRLGSRAPRPGDRAPDAVLDPEGKRRLHALLHGPHVTLLLFAGDAPDLASRCDDFAEDMTRTHGSLLSAVVLTRSSGASRYRRQDETGAAHLRYGAARGAIYLVRPDGYIAFRGGRFDGDALRGALARWLRPQPMSQTATTSATNHFISPDRHPG
jgi:2-polyprenyl-6-methoxyphenol hydroxylase-like FAD-dependent oxidoreductase